ncbi:unnamed protein product [Victoria cruziana]
MGSTSLGGIREKQRGGRERRGEKGKEERGNEKGEERREERRKGGRREKRDAQASQLHTYLRLRRITQTRVRI